jgi:3-methylcrotonyl-CoA carboxylase beta subunit
VHLPGGLRRRLPADAGRGVPDVDDFGRIFFNQATMSAAGIPQIAAVMGSCTAGGAYVPAMSDEAVIVKGTGTIFLGGPPLVKAATGEDVTAEELGGATSTRGISGVADHFAESTTTTPSKSCASIVATLPARPVANADRAGGGAALRPARDLRRGPEELQADAYDVREVIARLVDGSRFREFKARYGTTLSRASRGWGILVGIVANNGILFSESALKGAHFIELCNLARHPAALPPEHHRLHGRQGVREGGIAKDGAKMVHAVANAAVPKLTVVIGGSFGAGNYGMCGRAYSPRFLWMWPNSADQRDGRRAGGERAAHGEARSARAREEDRHERRGRRALQGAHHRQVRGRGQPLLLDRAAVGRRHPRSRPDPRRARARVERVHESAQPTDPIRRIQNVREIPKWLNGSSQ